MRERSKPLRQRAFAVRDAQAGPSWIRTRATGPGALYNAGNLLALIGGIAVNMGAVGQQSGFAEALYTHLVGSSEAAWLTLSMILFLLSGEIYHRAYQQCASLRLVAWGDLVSGLAAIVLTVALIQLGDTAAALLAGFMLILGKLGSGMLLLLFPPGLPRLDRILRLTVVASRIPSILALSLTVVRTLQGRVPFDSAILPLIMIVCFLLWLWADLLLLRRR